MQSKEASAPKSLDISDLETVSGGHRPKVPKRIRKGAPYKLAKEGVRVLHRLQHRRSRRR